MTSTTVTMDGLASKTFRLYLLLFVFTGAKGQQLQCMDRWFGDKCQYQCHCLYNAVCDKTTGGCPGDCDREWFGPQCQYRDAAYKGSNSYLVDGIPSTCLGGNSLHQNFTMTHDVMFTWMRVVTNKPGVFDNVTMTFYLRSGAEVNPKSGGLTYILVNPTILEIHGKLQDRLRRIRLGFDSRETRLSFCTMQVSSGRNVAIKQNAYQSSTDGNNSADKAVDGKPNHYLTQGSCTSTQLEDSSYWALNLSMPATVNMYTIFNIADWQATCPLYYFRLESYYQSTKVQQHDETQFQYAYNVDAVTTSSITSVTLKVSKDFWPNDSDGCVNGKFRLRFCEMQIFGDVDCPRGQWGRDCEKVCKCQNSFESCFVSTGMCPSGCKAGFQGPGCQEECDAKYYGENCAKMCSDKCKDQLCHHVTGACESCPDGKQISLDCSKDCSPGFYGPNCRKQCSEHCAGDGHCNNVDGRCNSGCKPGYISYNCEQECGATYYGENCATRCSATCLYGLCDHITGVCESCPNGKLISMDCSKDCSPGFYGPNCTKQCSKHCGGDGVCSNIDGRCLNGCKAGYTWHNCEQKCGATYYGEDCATPCSATCIYQRCHHITGVCENCPYGKLISMDCSKDCSPGLYGPNCTKQCSEHCGGDGHCSNIDGTCLSGCKPGYISYNCEQECEAKFYGQNCATPCSDMCIYQRCHHITGVCNNCPDGKQISKDCSQDCSPGSFGARCANQCSEHCGGEGFCNNINGSCLTGCKAGYRSHNCEQTCAHTTYGEGCNKNCSVNCVVNATQEPAVCEHLQGQCLLGCVSGYSGITCEEIPSEPDEINAVIIVVPILLVIVLVAAVIFGIWFWRRRKTQKNGIGYTGHRPIREQSGIHMVNNAQRSSDHPSTTNPYEMAEEIREDQVDVYMNTPETQFKFSKTAMPVESLGDFLASHNMDFLTEQFQKMPECTATTKVAESSENKHKNRYKNILAYDHSRVRLQENSAKKQEDYYNANFIQGFDGTKYIASQGPNKAVLADFIRMIWEQDVEIVVMLTKVVEDGKAKCESYWPINDATEVIFGEITVKLAATQVLADYTKRILQLTKLDGQSRFVTQYHFTSWPDKGVPETPWALVDFEQVVDNHYDTEKPLLVHCSAGVGRTGTFIALRNVLKEAKVTGYVDFYQTVAKMRQDRVFMIQTVEQYCFLHDAVQVALLCQDALMTTAALDDRMKVLMEVTDTGETNIEKEFKMVCALVRKEISNDSETAATEYVNTKETGQNFFTNIKNRFSTVQAKKEHRPKLADPENDYINAVLVPSMTKQDQQVLTQLPLPNTVEDFWSLVTQYNVSLIVAFDSDKEIHDEPVGDYLPKDNKPLECGHFEIRGDKVTHGAFWERAKIHVQAKVKNPSYVHHIKCTKSNLDTKDWLVLTKELHSMAPLGNDRTLYMCMNGADQSGFACVVSLLLNRVEHDHFLTVPLVVGEIKSIRPEVIPNKDQYCFLYKILQLHCETSNVYTNHIPQSIRNTHNGVRRHSQPEHVYTNALMSNESKEKMAAGNKAQAKRTVSEGKPLSKGSKSRPASSPEQPLTKQNLKPHNGSGEPLGYF